MRNDRDALRSLRSRRRRHPLISWANGTYSIVESGWWQPHLGGLEADTEVFGTNGYTRIWPTVEIPPNYEHCSQPMYSAQMAEFVDAILDRRAPRPTGKDGRVVLQVVEDAYRSSRLGDRADRPTA